jgi:hypothetical protein
MFRLLPSSDQYKIFNSLITYLCDILITTTELQCNINKFNTDHDSHNHHVTERFI